MANLPTVTDVAALARVSRQTVSNVLNMPSVVRQDTRERVQSAIDQLGYRPHASARRLRTQKSSTIGVRLDPVTDGISGSVLDRFLHALTEQADRKGLRVLLFTASDPEDEIRQFQRLIEGADVDAFVLASTFHGDPRTQWLIDHGQPFVTFGRPWGIDDMNDPNHLWVDVDGRFGVREATLQQLGAGGMFETRTHEYAKRIGYIGWPSPSGTGDERRMGWLEAMLNSSGLEPAEIDDLQVATDENLGNGMQAMNWLTSLPGGVEGVVCASDSLALGALMASGGRIPITGYDNTPVAASIGFSSVDQPVDEVATGVLELLTGVHGGRVRRARQEEADGRAVGAGASGASASYGAPAGSAAASTTLDEAFAAEFDATSDPQHRLVRPTLVTRKFVTPTILGGVSS